MKVRVSTDVESGVTTYSMWCPGCDHLHAVNSLAWQFDGDRLRPTFSPSILLNNVKGCHSYVRNGMWEYLPDSDHKLTGQTVPMVELPDWLH